MPTHLATAIEYVGPTSGAAFVTDGSDAVVFAARTPNPKFDPDEFHIERGVKKYLEQPTNSVAYLLLTRSRNNEWHVGQATTLPEHQRQGIMKKLYEMAFKWAKSKGDRICSGWVQSPFMDHYWHELEDQDKAEGFDDKHNVGNRGWCQKAAKRVAARHLSGR